MRRLVAMVLVALTLALGLPAVAEAATTEAPASTLPPGEDQPGGAKDLPVVDSVETEPPPETQPDPATVNNGGLTPVADDVRPEVALDGEVVSMRDQFSRTYITDEFGVYRTASSVDAINFQTPDGKWQPIDLTMTDRDDRTADDPKAGVLSPSGSGLPVEIAKTANADQWVKLPVRDGQSLAWSLTGAAPAIAERAAPVEPESQEALEARAKEAGVPVSGLAAPRPETLTYRQVLPSVDVELTTLSTGLKEELVLNGPEAATSFEFPLHTEGLTARVDRDTGAVVFADAEGVDQLVIPKGWMRDSAKAADGAEGVESDGVRYELAGTADAPILRVTLDGEWLRAPERVFPVRVDPTSTQIVASEDTYVNSCYTNNYSAANPIKLGGADCQRAAYAKFNVSSLAGKTILDADFGIANTYSYSCSARNVYIYKVTSSWTGAGVSSWPGPSFATPEVASNNFASAYNSACPGIIAYFDITGLVSGWVGGSIANYGITMRASATTTGDSFTYKEFASAETIYPPSLFVSWTDPNDPVGNYELGAPGAASVLVGGWALDPNTYASTDVHVYVDSTGYAMTANVNRPDVGALYPAWGANHGFYASLPASPGNRNVCAYAINVGAGTNVLLGCKVIGVMTGNPIGYVDSLIGLPDAQLRAVGWTLDPDSSGANQMHVYVDSSGYATNANVARSDIGTVYPGYGPNHGFDVTVPAAKGTRYVCAYGINTVAPGGNVLLAPTCQNVVIPTGQVTGTWEVASAAPGELMIDGWAYDPDTAGAVTVQVTVDGGAATNYTANVTRADATTIPDPYGDNHGFGLRVPATLGNHTVCVTAVDASGGQANKPINRPAANSGPSANCATVTVTDNGIGAQKWYSTTGFGVTDRADLQVNLASGNATANAQDLSLAGRGGFGFGMSRHYSSRTSDSGMFGPGWFASTGADVRIDALTQGATTWQQVTLGQGTKVLFASAGGGNWTASNGANARLDALGGGGWKLQWYENGTTQWFNSSGQLVAHTDRGYTGATAPVSADMNSIIYTYSSGKLATIIDTYGRTTTVTYTGSVVTKIKDSANREFNYAYTSGKLTSVTDPEGDVTTYTYNSGHGDLETVVNNSHTTTITYTGDRATKVARQNTPSTDDTTFSYSLPSEKCSNVTPALQDALHGCTTVTDPLSNVTYHWWDATGRLVKTVDPLGNFTATAWGTNNNVQSYTDALGAANSAVYDGNNRFTSSTNANNTTTSTWTYNSGVPSSNTKQYWQPETSTDQQSKTTTYAYDAVGNMTSSSLNGEVTKAWYNADGSVDYINDARSANDLDTAHRTDYLYNGSGDVTGIDHPAPLGDETRSPDSLSRTSTHTDGKGTTVTYTYDGVDRIKTVTYSTGQNFSFTYDDAGNITQRTDPSGTWNFTYDTQNRMLTKTKSGVATQTLVYDKGGNLTSYNDGGGAVTYTYDARNQVDHVTIPGLQGVGYVDADYDPAQRRSATKYPNGVTENLEYWPTGALKRIGAQNGATTLTSFEYTYTDSGSADRALRQTVTDIAGNLTTYGYDGSNRLDTAVTKNNVGTTTASWDYDYDGVGNINKIVTGPTATTTYRTYNNANQLCSSGATLTPSCPGSPTFSFDLNGNQTANGAQAFTYNPLDQTTGITDPAGANNQAMTYAGGSQDERLTRGGAGYTNGAFGTVAETTAGQTARYRYDDAGTLLVRQGPGGSSDTQYYLRDGLGSIVALVDTTGALVANYTYDPYGKTLTATGTKAADNPWRYASGYTDQTTGLTKFGTRYYNADQGRWAQTDPSAQDYGYNYAGSNPVNAVDPTGRSMTDCGIISCTLYLNTDETKWATRGAQAVLLIIAAFTAGWGTVAVGGIALAAQIAMEEGQCLKFKVGPQYSTPTRPYTIGYYSDEDRGC